VTATNARSWLASGVNRLSIGTQSFDDRVLDWMHRVHDANTAYRAIGIARNAGFHNISLDLIFALPVELERDWKRDLDAALELRPEHLSLYGLTVEPLTPLARWRDRGIIAEAPDERYESEFLIAHEAAIAAGYDHYEVSNFALSGHSSRHNRAYWSGVAYHGYGPSAHRFDGVQRAWNQRAYTNWLGSLSRGDDPTEDSEVLTDEQRELEAIYLGLRTRSGVTIRPQEVALVSSWEAAGWAELVGSREEAGARTAGRSDAGLLHREASTPRSRDAGCRVRPTALGWLRLDALVNSLTVSGSPCKV
jgi:oxygen-independent coproporphyrinogen-3 oxidase